jgi:SAM-dependent methyltransferase
LTQPAKVYIDETKRTKKMRGRTPLVLAASIVSTLLAAALFCIAHFDWSNRTYDWFSADLPPPREVAAWSAAERYDRLFRLSRWDGFLSGAQFTRFVRDQLAPLALNRTARFRFLEVGVGVGAFASEVLRLYPRSEGVGVDVVPGAVAIAAAVLPPERMSVHVGDMRALPLAMIAAERLFDVVLVPGALCYLGHMHEVRAALAGCARVLRPGGGLCASMLASDTSSMGSCNVRIPQRFFRSLPDFALLRLDEMDDWRLPHAIGRYSVCLTRR